MPIDLYHSEPSSFCRSVRLTLRALGLEANLINVKNIHDHNPAIKAINPCHTIPTMKDGDFVLWESRAINNYLVTQYANNDQLYPKDTKTRAIVDRLLYFDCGSLNYRLWNMVVPVMHKEADKAVPFNIEKFRACLGYLETFLEGNRWVAGTNHFTVADIAIVATLCPAVEGNMSLAKYPNIKAWMTRCENVMPGYKEINIPGSKLLAAKVPPGAGLGDI